MAKTRVLVTQVQHDLACVKKQMDRILAMAEELSRMHEAETHANPV